jgi:hypothetical protein
MVKVEKLLAGSDDAFFQAVFAYLKRKFEVRFTALTAMQNNTEKVFIMRASWLWKRA